MLDVIRQAPKETHLALQSLAPELAIEKLVGHLDQAISEALQGRTLKDLALLEPEPVSSDSEAPEKQISLSGRSRDS